MSGIFFSTKKKIEKIKNSINFKASSFVINNGKLIFIDQKSNIFLYDNKFKKIWTINRKS